MPSIVWELLVCILYEIHKMQAHFELWALILAVANLSLTQTFADYAYVSNIEAGSRFQTVSRASLTKQAWVVASGKDSESIRRYRD